MLLVGLVLGVGGSDLPAMAWFRSTFDAVLYAVVSLWILYISTTLLWRFLPHLFYVLSFLWTGNQSRRRSLAQ